MSSMPLICCSSGDATVSAMTFGLAPGYAAWTTTVGGTTCGRSLIGNRNSASAPAATTSSDRTAANIGRSMKNFENVMAASIRRNRLHARARPDPLQAVDDDRLAGLQPGANHAQPVDDGTERDRAVLDLVLRRDD